MKRALLLAVSLAAVLALLWLVTRSEPPTQAGPLPSVLAAATAQAPAASARTESEPAPVTPLEREVLAVPTRVEQETEPIATAADPLPGPMAKVRGRVVKRRTQERVRGEVRLVFLLPGEERAGQEGRSVGLDHVMRSTMLDDQGRFEFEFPLATLVHQLTVSPLVHAHDSPRNRIDAASQFVMHVEQPNLRLSEAGLDFVVEVEDSLQLSGLVCDADTLAPLEGVRIRVPEASRLVPDATSGPDGRFTLTGFSPALATRRWDLRVDRMDHLPRLVHVEAAQLAPDAQPLVVALSRGLAIAGSVVDEQGVPVRGAVLRIHAVGFDPGIEFSAGLLTTRTDDQGTFRYAPVPPCGALGVLLPAQRCDGRDLFHLQRDFGPLRADRTDLQLQARASGLLEVRAQLVDGTVLSPREFQVICMDTQGVQFAGPTEAGVQLRVPVGVDLELEAYSSAREEQEPARFVRARLRVRLEPRDPAPRPVQFVLAERSSFSAPPPRDGVRELRLPDEDFLRATVDVQLLDASTGRPLETGSNITISGDGGGMGGTGFRDGWLRIRGRPGRHEFEVEIGGGAHQLMIVVIPSSGYGTGEWRLQVGP